jgi:hypothetical protein
MNFWSAQVSSRFWSSLLMALTIFFIAGCKVEDKTWIDKMLSEMETAWVEADKAGGGQNGRDTAVTAVAKKYFQPGMPKEEAFKLLRELKNSGYEINESRYEGTKIWPDGEFRSPWTPSTNPHADEATIRNVQRYHSKLKGISLFSASKMYGRERVIIKKTVAIKFKIADDTGVISGVEAALSADSI